MCFQRSRSPFKKLSGGLSSRQWGPSLAGGGLTKGGGSGQFEAAPGWWQIPEVLEQVLLLPEWQRGLVAKTHVC